MKNKINILLPFLFIILLLAVNKANASEGDIWLTPVNQNVGTSESFDIEVHVDTGGNNMGAFDIYFDFSTSDVSIDTSQGTDGVDKGTDGSSYSLVVNSTDLANGHLRIAGTISSGFPNGTDVHILTIHAQTTSSFSSGTSSLDLRVTDLLDENANALSSGTITGAVVTYVNKVSVYRFFNKIKGNHFYTMSSIERDNIINNLSDVWSYEGIAYTSYANQGYNTVPLYRFFNTQTGFHFYTKSEIEKNDIINNLPVWNYEGIAYYIYDSNADGTTAVYRFFNKIYGNHFYTTSSVERDDIINNLSDTWNYEGVAFYVLN